MSSRTDGGEPESGRRRRGFAAFWSGQTPVLRGIALMCFATVCFSSMHATIRHVSAELEVFQIAFLRNLFGLAFLIPVLAGSGFGQMRTQRLGLHALRGFVNVGAMLLFFSALAIAPLAKVTALNFTAPLFTAMLSVLFLGERFRARRWAAIACGFLGMMVILRPGLTAVETGALLSLASAVLWAVAMILIKMLSRTESSVAIVAWMAIFLSLFSLGPAIWTWRDPSAETWGWLVFIALVGTAAQVSLSQSLKETEPTAVLPFDFLKLIWTALLGAWLYAEIPDVWTLLGAVVIFSSAFYVVWRERRDARAAAVVPPPHV